MVVQVRTDLVPGSELDAIVVRLRAGADPDDTVIERRDYVPRSGDDFVAGVTVAELLVPEGIAYLDVAASRDTVDVLVRPVAVDVRGPTAVTILLTRSCLGIECPDADDASAIACIGGVCAPPDCTPETPATCPATVTQCTSDSDCSSAPCASASCADGVCLAPPRASATPCTDDDACTENGMCDGAGVCVSEPVRCGDFGCNACDPTDGCTAAVAASSPFCDPGLCDASGTCQAIPTLVDDTRIIERISADGEWLAAGGRGSIAMLRRTTDGTLAFHSTLTPPADGVGGQFGWGVSLEGDRLAVAQGGVFAVGPPLALRVYGYETSTDQWELLDSVTTADMTPPSTTNESFMYAMHMAMGRIVARFEVMGEQRVAILTSADERTWAHTSTLTFSVGPLSPELDNWDQVSAEGDLLVVGDGRADGGAGRATLFEWNGASYDELTVFRSAAASTGFLTAIADGRVYVLSSDAGSVTIDIWTGTDAAWTSEPITLAWPEPAVSENLEVNASWLVLGSAQRVIEGVTSGAVAVLANDATSLWLQRALVRESTLVDGAFFGAHTALVGDRLTILSRTGATPRYIYDLDLAPFR